VTTYPLVDVSKWKVTSIEASGVEEKLWLEDGDGAAWLYKGVTRHETEDRGIWDQREHAAERIATDLAVQLAIPCARTELATINETENRPGTISRDVAPTDPSKWELQPGAVLLTERDPGFAPNSDNRTGHTLEAIADALSDVYSPPGFTVPDGFGAFDVFVGYLVFDALIANQDRHEENWAILLAPSPTPDRHLAPSFDHGSCLGYNVLDTRIETYLASDQVELWARKGCAHRFERRASDAKPLNLVQFAHLALTMAGPAAREHWLGRLELLSEGEMDESVDRMAGLSQPTATFCKRVLVVNRRRLLDEG
jgi:hypothetical protein